MHTKAASLDNRKNLFDSNLSTIVGFLCASGNVATVEGSENQRLKYQFVFVVEGAIEKDIPFIR